MTHSAPGHFRAILAGLGLAGIIAGTVGCPGTLDDPERFTDGGAAACGDVTTTVFQPTCAQAGCHSTDAKAQGLDLQSMGVAYRLVGVNATEGPGLLIDPTSPSKSVLYTKLTATPPFGLRMPFGKPPLDDATTACVLSWIAMQTAGSDAGAAESGTPQQDAASE